MNTKTLKPVLYFLIVLCGLVGPFVFKLRTEGIFACSADGYAENHYLAYCHVRGYADYDHGAVWFNFEPDVERFAEKADVLFLGNSRMQFAFSSQATQEWFTLHHVRHYLFGFSSTENITFTTPLLSRIQPHARVYVINVDRFFEDRETDIGKEILREPDARERTNAKRLWQFLHRPICSTIPALCGAEISFFRFRETGTWQMRGIRNWGEKATADAPATDIDRWDHFIALGRQFISQLPVDHHCIILTTVPSPTTRQEEAAAIARALGLDLLTPHLDHLVTFDGIHLNASSAERWSRAFFEMASPHIHECLNGSASRHESSTHTAWDSDKWTPSTP